MAIGVPASVIGLIVSGDLGGYTIYTDRHQRKIVFPKAPPKEPPTIHQTRLRERFRLAQAEYMAASPPERSAWEQLTLRSSLCMTGQNLFIHVAMKHTFGTLTTIMQQTGVSVTPPTAV